MRPVFLAYILLLVCMIPLYQRPIQLYAQSPIKPATGNSVNCVEITMSTASFNKSADIRPGHWQPRGRHGALFVVYPIMGIILAVPVGLALYHLGKAVYQKCKGWRDQGNKQRRAAAERLRRRGTSLATVLGQPHANDIPLQRMDGAADEVEAREDEVIIVPSPAVSGRSGWLSALTIHRSLSPLLEESDEASVGDA